MYVKGRELYIILGITVLLALGNRVSLYFNCLAFLILVMAALCSKMEDSFRLLFFLLPCVRIMDNISVPGAVNVIYLIVGLKYVFCKMKISITVMSVTVFIFMMSFAGVGNSTDFLGYLKTVVLFVFDLFVFLNLLTEKQSVLEFQKCITAMNLGILCSSAVYIFCNPEVINALLTSVYRFEAYGNDPNYFSEYVIIGICGVLYRLKDSENIVYNTAVLAVLIGIELCTSSRTGMICVMAAVMFYIFLMVRRRSLQNFRVLLTQLCVLLVIGAVFWEKFIYFARRFFARFLEVNQLYQDTSRMANLTAGRSVVVSRYLSEFFSEFSFLMFGKGLEYDKYYGSRLDVLIAHNTYLDILFSFGIVGTAVIFLLFVAVFKQIKIKPGMETILPLLIYGASLCMLSSLTTDMFWYLLILCMQPVMQLKTGTHNTKTFLKCSS